MEELEEIFRFGTEENKEKFVNSYEPKLRAKASYVWDTYQKCNQVLLAKMKLGII